MDFINVIAFLVLATTFANVLHWALLRRTCRSGILILPSGTWRWVFLLGMIAVIVLANLSLIGSVPSMVGGVFGLVLGLMINIASMWIRQMRRAETARVPGESA